MKKLPEPITCPPSKEELAGRLGRVRTLMAKQNLDTYVSFDPVNIYYLRERSGGAGSKAV